jgi:UDP-N-acetylglucosamine--N-acetylmuramyl-(pentapeptide) pyrophosphoryl-undecaprenol N-acetylglucosamine transferase
MHQQDVPPNLSNKQVAPLATRISVAFEDSLAYFPARKTLLLGNPVRQEILDVRQLSPQEARRQLGLAADQPLLLVTGGSQGARHLNQTVCQALPQLLASSQVLHISGKELYIETREQAHRVLTGVESVVGERYHLVPYLDAQMPAALQAADLVLCRAGASTLSELATLSKPGLLVPLPAAIGKSPQEANARMFAHRHAGVMIKNADLQPAELAAQVSRMLTSPGTLASLTEAAGSLARPQATQAIVEELRRLARINRAQ